MEPAWIREDFRVNPDSPHSRKADAEGAESAELHGNTGLLYRDTSGAILGAFYSVHSELGSGFLEAVYANALTVLLRNAGLRVDRQVPFEIVFHGQTIGNYRADLVVESRIVVEIKADDASSLSIAPNCSTILRPPDCM